MFTTSPIVCCLLFLLPCYLSQSVTITISPDTIYFDSNATITCLASANSATLLALVPFYLINGTHIQHSCVGNIEYQPLTQNFSTLPYVPTGDSTLSSRISLSPVSSSDDGLNIGCVFYNLITESIISSSVLTLSVLPPTSGPNITDVNITTTATNTEAPFVNSRSFHVTVGSVGGVIVLLVIIALLLIIIIPLVVCAVKKSKRRKPSTTGEIIEHNIYNLSTADTPVAAPKPKEEPDELIKSRTNSIKVHNEKEFASRYSALPTYSVAVNMEGDQLSASTDPNAPHQFTSVDVEKEKL